MTLVIWSTGTEYDGIWYGKYDGMFLAIIKGKMLTWCAYYGGESTIVEYDEHSQIFVNVSGENFQGSLNDVEDIIWNDDDAWIRIAEGALKFIHPYDYWFEICIENIIVYTQTASYKFIRVRWSPDQRRMWGLEISGILRWSYKVPSMQGNLWMWYLFRDEGLYLISSYPNDMHRFSTIVIVLLHDFFRYMLTKSMQKQWQLPDARQWMDWMPMWRKLRRTSMWISRQAC